MKIHFSNSNIYFKAGNDNNPKSVQRYTNLSPLKADLVSFGARKPAPVVIAPSNQSSNTVENKKMFESIQDLKQDLGEKLKQAQDTLPEKLYKDLEGALSNNNFDLKTVYTDYYMGLKKCKTLKETAKKYPELVMPKTPREMIKEDLKSYISPVTYHNAKEMKAHPQELEKYLDYKLKQILSDNVKKGPYGNVLNSILGEIKQELIKFDFENIPPIDNTKIRKYGQTTKLTHKMLFEDVDKIGLHIIKKQFLGFVPFSNISIKFSDGNTVKNVDLKQANYVLPSVPNKVRNLINASEAEITRFEQISKADDKVVENRIKANAVKISGINSDFLSITKKHWQTARALITKANNPQETYFTTTKMIDAYLLNLFESGKVHGIVANPLEDFSSHKSFNKEQKQLVELLYEGVPKLETKKDILQSEEFKKFKKQFDTKAMRSSISKLETRYKQGFFKWFWTDERKGRYEKALESSRKILDEKTEIYKDFALKNRDYKSTLTSNEEVKDTQETDDEALLASLIKAEEEENKKFEKEFERLYEEEQTKLNEIKSSIIEISEKIKDNKTLLNYFYQYCSDEVNETNKADAELFIDIIKNAQTAGEFDEKKAEAILRYHEYAKNFSFYPESEQELFLNAQEQFTDNDFVEDKEKIGRFLIDNMRYSEQVTAIAQNGTAKEKEFLAQVKKTFTETDGFDIANAGKTLAIYAQIPQSEREDFVKFLSDSSSLEDFAQEYKSHIKSKIDTFVECKGENGAVYECVFTAKLKSLMLKKNFSLEQIERFERRMGKMTESASSTTGVILLQTAATNPIYEVKVQASNINDRRVIGRRDKATQRIIFSELSMNAHSGSEIVHISRRLDKDGGPDKWMPEKLLNGDKEAQKCGEKILEILNEID